MKVLNAVIIALSLLSFHWIPVQCEAASIDEPRSFDRKNMRVLYAADYIDGDDTVKVKLRELRNAGMNTIIVSGSDIATLSEKITKIRADEVLSEYKILLNFCGEVFDVWHARSTYPDVCQEEMGNEFATLPEKLKLFLTSVVQLALANQDIVVGYYVTDEPALATRKDGNGNVLEKGMCKQYQKKIYEYIRNLDQDYVNRPVCLANTMWSLKIVDGAAPFMGPDLQDLIFVEVYEDKLIDLQENIGKWKDSELLSTNPVVFVFPAFNKEKCQSINLVENFQMLNNVIKEEFGDQGIVSYGNAYFSFWPNNKPDFKYAMDNCPAMYSAVLDHLAMALRPDLKINNITTSPTIFQPGAAVTFSVEIVNDGLTATPDIWNGVVMLDNGSCFPGGCSWGGLSESLAPGETATITMNTVWYPTAGIHEIMAIVDDQYNIQESNESNNQLTRRINVGSKPDLTVKNLTTTPVSFQPGEQVRFSVTVTNQGSIDTDNEWVGVLYLVDGQCPPSDCIWGGTMQNIAPGESLTLNTNYSFWTAIEGMHTFTALIDDNNLIDEVDETNNTVTRTTNVSNNP